MYKFSYEKLENKVFCYDIHNMRNKYATKIDEHTLGIKSEYIGIGLVYETRNFIIALMDNPKRLQEVANASYCHKNGFVKLILGQKDERKKRLHYYPVGAKADENVHNHRWDLNSTILVGSLPSYFYKVDYYGEQDYLHAYRKNGHTGEYEIVVTGKCTATEVAYKAFSAGTNYTLPHSTHHRIGKVETPTVTLMRTSNPVSNQCDLINRIDRSGPGAEVEPPLSIQQVLFYLEEVVELLNMEICQLSNYNGGV